MYIYIHAAVAEPWPWPCRGRGRGQAVVVGRGRGRGHGRDLVRPCETLCDLVVGSFQKPIYEYDTWIGSMDPIHASIYGPQSPPSDTHAHICAHHVASVRIRSHFG